MPLYNDGISSHNSVFYSTIVVGIIISLKHSFILVVTKHLLTDLVLGFRVELKLAKNKKKKQKHKPFSKCPVTCGLTGRLTVGVNPKRCGKSYKSYLHFFKYHTPLESKRLQSPTASFSLLSVNCRVFLGK